MISNRLSVEGWIFRVMILPLPRGWRYLLSFDHVLVLGNGFARCGEWDSGEHRSKGGKCRRPCTGDGDDNQMNDEDNPRENRQCQTSAHFRKIRETMQQGEERGDEEQLRGPWDAVVSP